MSDEEIVCGFMEPKPPSAPEYWMVSGELSTNGGWWMAVHLNAGVNKWLPSPSQTESLDALREVEAKLSDEQWRQYESLSVEWWSGGPKIISGFRAVANASAEQKLKALASVLSSKEKS